MLAGEADHTHQVEVTALGVVVGDAAEELGGRRHLALERPFPFLQFFVDDWTPCL